MHAWWKNRNTAAIFTYILVTGIFYCNFTAQNFTLVTRVSAHTGSLWLHCQGWHLGWLRLGLG